MKRLCLTGLIVLLGACAHQPIVTKCVTREQYDEIKRGEPDKVGDQLTGDAAQDIKPISGSAIRLRAWGRGMLDVLGGCVDE